MARCSSTSPAGAATGALPCATRGPSSWSATTTGCSERSADIPSTCPPRSSNTGNTRSSSSTWFRDAAACSRWRTAKASASSPARACSATKNASSSKPVERLTPEKTMRAQRLKWAAPFTAAVLLSSAAPAGVTLKTDDGWSVGFAGYLNGFGGYERGSVTPGNVVAGPLLTTGGGSGCRVRAGLLPGLLGFTVGAPSTEGLGVKARVGL